MMEEEFLKGLSKNNGSVITLDDEDEDEFRETFIDPA